MEEQRESLLPSWLVAAMKATDQNPKYHAEGNVWNHSMLVLEMFEQHHSEFDLSDSDKTVLYWTALLHDIGKPAVTKWKVNRWVAHGHEDSGIPFARNILLNQPDVTPKQRRQILDLVKHHSIPLQGGLKQWAPETYRHLATQTDLRLMGIFSFFDLMGRMCAKKDWVMSMDRHFNEQIVPKVQYEWGSYEEIQEKYSKAPIQQKNALWNSLKFKDSALTGKLLASSRVQPKIPEFQVYMTVALPNSAKKAYLEQNYSHCRTFPLSGLNLSMASAHQRENYLRQVKHFISVWGRARKHILIDGELTDEYTRRYITNFCKNLGGEVSYLIFEEEDPRYNDYFLPKDPNFMDVIHPWEAHRMEYIQLDAQKEASS